MGVESSIGSKVLLRLVISILAIISLEDWIPSESFKFCEPPKCGDSVKGPPWDGAGPCCPDKPLLLEPLWDDHVDYDNQSHALISEFEKRGDACFATPKSSTRRPSVFEPHGRSYLAFLRDCSSFPNVDSSYPHSTCPSPGPNLSYVALTDGPEDPRLKPLVCGSHVIVPVKPAGPDSEEIGNDDHDGKWKRGFRLKWNLTSWENCVQCQKSGGNCGGSDGQFRCSCSGKKHPHPCERGK